MIEKGMPRLVGKTLAEYQVTEEIGRGGMAIVYKAWDNARQQYVALKVLPPYFQQEVALFERFRREAQAAIKLNHPNIVSTFDTGESEGICYIAMEYVDGGSLAHKLEGGKPLDPPTVAKIIGPIAEGLEYAHAKKMVHRDLKPMNILLTKEGVPKISDFGIAKIGGQSTMTQTGTVIGTPEYMSPEQAKGEKNIDGRSDVYSLGIVLYQMLTGHVPFSGDTPHSVLYGHIYEPPKPPSRSNRSISQLTELVMLRALHKSREERYQSARQLATDLQAAIQGAPWLPSMPWPQPVYDVTMPVRRPKRSTLPLVTCLISVIVLFVAVIGLFVGRGIQFAPVAVSTAPLQFQTTELATVASVSGGSVSGVVTLSCSMPANRPIYLSLSIQPRGVPSGYGTTLSQAGSYRIENVPEGQYYVTGYIDVDGDAKVTSGDILGIYGSTIENQLPVAIARNSPSSNVNVNFKYVSRGAGQPPVECGQATTLSTPAGATQSPVAQRSPLPTFTPVTLSGGSISGAVVVNCPYTGDFPINVGLVTEPGGRGHTNLGTSIDRPGPYTISGIPDGKYFVAGHVDLDKSRDLSAGDIWGGYPDFPERAVTIAGANALTAVNIDMKYAVTGDPTMMFKPCVGSSASQPSPAATISQPTPTRSPTVSGGSVSGTVTVVGATDSHPLFVELSRKLAGGPAEYVLPLSKPGAYTFAAIPVGQYYVLAILDGDDTGRGPLTTGDSWARYTGSDPRFPQTITVADGQALTAIDIIIRVGQQGP